MSDPSAVLVWCPFPDKQSARNVATLLLDERLIACANIIGEIESLFEWKGEVGQEIEVAVLFKTTSARSEILISRLGEVHPYDTPAILGWTADKTYPDTLAWLKEEVRGDPER